MFNFFGTRTPAQKAADPNTREQNRKRNAALAQEKLQEMSKREEFLEKKVQHIERQVAAVKAEAQAKLKAGNKAGGVFGNCVETSQPDGITLFVQPRPC